MIRFFLHCAMLSATATTLVAGGSSNKPTPPVVPAAPGTPEIRVSNEFAPAGGTVQIKAAFTNPQPIMSGGTFFDIGQLDGFALWSPLGDAYGVAVVRPDGRTEVKVVSPLGSLGSALDYPFMTLTTDISAASRPGTVVPENMTGLSIIGPNGPLTTLVKPGSITTAGTFSIHGVVPGGGTYPAGTTVRIYGSGFTPNASLRTPQFKINSFKVSNANEIEFTLKNQTTLDAQPIEVTVAGVTQTYYSYLRGTPLHSPSKPLLRAADPAFQQLTHALADTGALPAQTLGHYTALALQNSNPGPSVATLTLISASGVQTTAMIVLPSGARVVDDIASLVGAPEVRSGDRLTLVATAPLQILGLRVDEQTWSATAFLPTF